MMDPEWVDSQTNSALLRDHDVSRAYVELVPYALPTHNDRYKNWDAALALHHAYFTTDPDEPVLDAGACRDPAYPSPFLPGLQKLGFRHLTGCNLDEPRMVFDAGIHYEPGDITKLRYAPGTFGFVACLSVIEHGVDRNLFVEEMARIIKPGGHLFVSFDYWQDKIKSAAHMFGAAHNILCMDEVDEMITHAYDHGLVVTSDCHLECQDRVVHWAGLSYTFCNLLFRKSHD